MEYPVPQFIEVESKLVGPLTLKQFIYLAGGGGMCLLLLKFLPFIIAIVLCLPVAGFAAALAFYKINNKPFINMVESAAKFYASSKLFLWRKEQKKVTPQPAAKKQVAQRSDATAPHARLTRDKLHDLAMSLDINERGTNQ